MTTSVSTEGGTRLTILTGVLQCDMHHTCERPVTHIEEKGWIYCAEHAECRRSQRRIRKLRAWELTALRAGQTLSYRAASKREHDARLAIKREAEREAVSPTQMNVDLARPVACDNCQWTGYAADTKYISDLHERLDPGTGTVPAGQCPACDSLAYLTDIEK